VLDGGLINQTADADHWHGTLRGVVGEARERPLLESEVDADPFRQFNRWLVEAIEVGEPMARAMALATTSMDGMPSVRMVLLEEVIGDGFAFQTNLQSPKAHDLASNPRAAATFFWPSLVRQVRISGGVQELERTQVARYFDAMPEAIQAMLRACRQSEVIADRSTLERGFEEALKSGDRTLPDSWGGYCLRADWIEFFQARPNWLQDRLRYMRAAAGGWRIQRLEP
jgi:pyridoxamine 5'-phosphate oxidase